MSKSETSKITNSFTAFRRPANSKTVIPKPKITASAKKFLSAPKSCKSTRPKPKPQKKQQPVKKEYGLDRNEQYDILYLDHIIKDRLSKRMTALPDLQTELKDLTWLANNSESSSDKLDAINKSNILRNTIKDIQHGFDLTFYILRTHELLQSYKKIVSASRNSSFIKTTATDKNTLNQKYKIVDNYLAIANDYIDVSNEIKIMGKRNTSQLICNVCYGTDFISEDDDGMIMVCKECSATIELIDTSPSFKDTDRVNMASRYTYSCRAHFLDAMNCFECKQRNNGLDKVANILLECMDDHNLTRESVSKNHLYMFLAEKGLSINYKDVNWLFSYITSTPGPDISQYRNELLSIHDYLEEAFLKVKNPNRINSLTVNYKLYKSLQLVSYPCRKDDFYFLKTPNKQVEHDKIWKDMIEYLAEKYPDDLTIGGKKRWRLIHTY